MLQLTEGLAPLGPERMPTLGAAKKSQGNPFRSYGYRSLEKCRARPCWFRYGARRLPFDKLRPSLNQRS
ncbi:MAG TPA: hypothetical protein VI451_20890 [Anaerolineales bacterium]|nr:hypothetical protein [Anaerolineales bacterium]